MSRALSPTTLGTPEAVATASALLGLLGVDALRAYVAARRPFVVADTGRDKDPRYPAGSLYGLPRASCAKAASECTDGSRPGDPRCVVLDIREVLDMPPPAVLSRIVTHAARPPDNCVSPNLATLRALIERGRPFTWCDPKDGWIEPDAHRTHRAALAELHGVTGGPDFKGAHPDDAANFARYRVVDLRPCLPLIVAGDAPRAMRCGPGTPLGNCTGWPAGWIVPEADNPRSLRLRPDFPEDGMPPAGEPT